MMLKIGNRMVECDENRVIRATSKEILHPDGHVDVEIHVPSLKIQGKQPIKEIGKVLGLGAIFLTTAVLFRQFCIWIGVI